jgi:hypothetical protein
MAKKAGSKSRPSQPAKKASAEPPETEGPPPAPQPPKWTRFPPTPSSSFTLGNLSPEERQHRRDQDHRDQQAWGREQRQERRAREVDRALEAAQAAQRELEQGLEARSVRAVAEKLLGSGPRPPASARGTRRVRRGRKPYPKHERDLILADYQQRLDRNEPKAEVNSAQWAIEQVEAGKLTRAVHHDTIRAWHRKVRR